MLRKKLAVLLATVMMVVMSAAPALAHHDVGHVNGGHDTNNGHKLDDGADRDQGGGNDHLKQNKGKGND